MAIRRRTSFSIAGVLLAASLTSAQPPPVTQPPLQPARPQPQDPTPVPAAKPPELTKPESMPPPPAPAGRLTKSETKFSGCIQRAAATAAPEGATDGSRLSAGFVLTNATTTLAKDTKDGAPPAGTKEYRLVPDGDRIKLAEHVGHQVEVMGKISLADAAPSPTSTDAGTSSSRPSGSTGVSTPPSAAAVAAPVTLTVTSLKMVSSTCSTPAS
jgi:hypothetical protein